jgi:hypothetical protein
VGGTRADFYVGEGADAEWLGTVLYDGYPDGIDGRVYDASTEAEYRNAVSIFLTGRRGDTVLPIEGWPGLAKSSADVHYAYSFLDGKVWASNFGRRWFLVQPTCGCCEDFGDPDDCKTAVVRGRPDFPDMTGHRRGYPSRSAVASIPKQRSV